jgi:hypothetical protein
MEALSLEDRPQAVGQTSQQQSVLPAPPMVPQLPPQMFTTAAQLLDLTDSEWARYTNVQPSSVKVKG